LTHCCAADLPLYGLGTADRSRTDSGQPVDTAAYEAAYAAAAGGKRMLRVHSPNGSTFLREMTSWPSS